jgi:hypothetical protein
VTLGEQLQVPEQPHAAHNGLVFRHVNKEHFVDGRAFGLSSTTFFIHAFIDCEKVLIIFRCFSALTFCLLCFCYTYPLLFLFTLIYFIDHCKFGVLFADEFLGQIEMLHQ